MPKVPWRVGRVVNMPGRLPITAREAYPRRPGRRPAGRATRGQRELKCAPHPLGHRLCSITRASAERWTVPMSDPATPPGPSAQQNIDTSVPHSARIWNYWLGGKDNYPVDEQAGDAYTAVFPGIVTIARSSRAFLRRNITYLVTEAGIRQFLDIGTGLPTADNTHEVAQRLAPETRIVYVDNDPMVLAHARALLYSTPEGATAYVDSDVRDPERVLAA